MNNVITLGSKVVVSDPCYGLNTWCQGVLENVKPGAYFTDALVANTGSWGTRVCQITVVNEEYKSKYPEILFEELAEIEIGVDSGQAGIFDYDYYIQYHCEAGEIDHVDDEWYNEACSASNEVLCWDKIENAGIMDGRGFVSDSGFGDGGYPCLVAKNEAGEIIAIRIIFISPKEFDDAEE